VDRGVVSTPTIILLPYGRMLVVDGSVFAQLQADTSGLDLIELGENAAHARQQPTPTVTLDSLTGSVPSILDVDSETNSKDGRVSPTLGGLLPPTYESIFGSDSMADLPPSYDEILHQVPLQEAPESVNGEYEPGEIRESRV
jgi:cathepsin F